MEEPSIQGTHSDTMVTRVGHEAHTHSPLLSPLVILIQKCKLIMSSVISCQFQNETLLGLSSTIHKAFRLNIFRLLSYRVFLDCKVDGGLGLSMFIAMNFKRFLTKRMSEKYPLCLFKSCGSLSVTQWPGHFAPLTGTAAHILKWCDSVTVSVAPNKSVSLAHSVATTLGVENFLARGHFHAQTSHGFFLGQLRSAQWSHKGS